MNTMDNWLAETAARSPQAYAFLFSESQISGLHTTYLRDYYSATLTRGVDGYYRATYEGFREAVDLTANALYREGIKPGDRCAVLSDCPLETVTAIFALWRLRAVPAPLHIRQTAKELRDAVRRIDANFVIWLGDRRLPFEDMYDEVIPLTTLGAPMSRMQMPGEQVVGADDTAVLLFTSGSGGRAKTVAHTYRRLSDSAAMAGNALGLSSSDRWTLSLPIYHIGGFMILARAVRFGSSVVLATGYDTMSLEAALNAAATTIVSITPTQLKRLMEERVEPGAKHRATLVGGGGADPELIKRAADKGWKPVVVYGATETTAFVAALAAEDATRKPGSVGKPLPSVSISTIDDNGAPSDGEGEIVVASPTVAKGYYLDEKETMRKFVKGAFRTGDYGRIDEEGYIYIVGRIDGGIVTGGENVDPETVERAAMELDEIADAVAFGASDPEWGEAVCLATRVADGARFDAKAIREQLRERLADYQVPKRIYHIRGAIRNEMGKPLRMELRKRYDAR